MLRGPTLFPRSLVGPLGVMPHVQRTQTYKIDTVRTPIGFARHACSLRSAWMERIWWGEHVPATKLFRTSGCTACTTSKIKVLEDSRAVKQQRKQQRQQVGLQAYMSKVVAGVSTCFQAHSSRTPNVYTEFCKSKWWACVFCGRTIIGRAPLPST